ncbi:MAG: class I SAM-dependent methyltransferase [Paludibacter sp.]|nr:class I SAM-dependent methyltransferase [Paludibacter sp.]
MEQPDNTALRTALWWALHVQTDDKPHIIEDEIGLRLINPTDDWKERPDMKYTKRLRASVVARARFIEDLAKEQIAKGIKQYVLLGSRLDSFAQRNAEIASKIEIYEIDQSNTLNWKKEKLIENGYSLPKNLHFVPVDFETSSGWKELLKKDFKIEEKTFISCTGVTLYLTKEAIIRTLQQFSMLSSGSIIAIAFYLPIELLDEEDRPMQGIANKGAKESGTPFVSFSQLMKLCKWPKKPV